MDPRTDFQRLLEDMDKAMRRKQQELIELDERLEAVKEQLSEKEAKELLSKQEASSLNEDEDGVNTAANNLRRQDVEELLREQKSFYERQLSNINEELIELETNNQNLLKSSRQHQFEVDSLKVSNEKLRARLRTLEESFEEVQSANFELNIRLAKAESESQMQQKLLRKSYEQDQILMDAFNDKLESLKKVIETRDEEISRLRSDNQISLEELGINLDLMCEEQDTETDQSFNLNNKKSSNFDNRHQTIVQLVNLIREKDAQIAQLNNQLRQSTRELDKCAQTLEGMIKERVNESNGNTTAVEKHDLDIQTGSGELDARCRMLEIELFEKEGQLHSMEKRNRYFETILPDQVVKMLNKFEIEFPKGIFYQNKAQKLKENSGIEIDLNFYELAVNLNKLLREIKTSQKLLDFIQQLKRVIRSRDDQIRRLVRDLNRMGAEINHDHIESLLIDDLDEASLIKENENIEQHSEAVEKLSSAEQKFESIGEDAEYKDRSLVTSKNELNKQREIDVMDGNQHAHTTDKADDVTEFDQTAAAVISKHELKPRVKEQEAEKDLGKDKSKNRYKSGISKRSDNREPIRRIGQAKRNRPSWSAVKSMIEFRKQKSTFTFCNTNDHQQALNRLRQLENENQLLELAMKEILLSIKWSDVRCSNILIDCPSLERLCQLLEARYVANCVDRDLTVATVNENKTDSAQQGSEYYSSSFLTSNNQNSDDFGTINRDIFQFVVLKSELDILRGQNEQLRSELKLQRRDMNYILSNDIANAHTDPHERGKTLNEDTKEKKFTCEVECQTDSLVLLNFEQLEIDNKQPENLDEDGPEVAKKSRCNNCSRLVKLANHLLDCFLRIEARVNSSDESYICKLLALYQLTQRLSKDLFLKDNIINKIRRDCHILNTQKMMLETRLRSLESQNCKTTPPYYVTQNHFLTRSRFAQSLTNCQPYPIKDKNSDPVQRLTLHGSSSHVEVPLRNSQVTISLLHSIINCLQARLDYKDERLSQLEHLLVSN